MGIEDPIQLSMKLGYPSNKFNKIVSAEHLNLSIPEKEPGRIRKLMVYSQQRWIFFFAEGCDVSWYKIQKVIWGGAHGTIYSEIDTCTGEVVWF